MNYPSLFCPRGNCAAARDGEDAWLCHAGSKGEMSLAQRHLPLRPPPETWGRFDFAPTPPNDTKEGGCGPLLWIPPPPEFWGQQRVAKRNARKEKLVKSDDCPAKQFQFAWQRTEIKGPVLPAPNASMLNYHWKYLAKTAHPQTCPETGKFGRKRLSFGRARPFSLGKTQRKWGRIPSREPATK